VYSSELTVSYPKGIIIRTKALKKKMGKNKEK
jgi:hypothetical protein